MNIVYKKISELKHYKNNNKKHDDNQIKLICKSLLRYGFLQPIVIDKKNIIVVGHGRVLGASRAKMAKVPCLIAENLSEELINEYRIIDNKLNESAYNEENLSHEVEGLPDMLTYFDDIDFSMGVIPDDDAFDSLQKGDKRPYQTVSFVFHDSVISELKKAMDKSKSIGKFDEFNGYDEMAFNSKVMARIINIYNTQNG